MVFLSFLRRRNATFKPISHVIFDIDGLLLRTEDIYYKIDKTIVEKYGGTFDWNVRLKVLGRTEFESAEIITKECKLPIEANEFRVQVHELQMQFLREAPFMPGAQRIIKHLSRHKILMAVATSSGAESVAAKTARHKKLFALFSHIVMASSDPDIKRGKPEPDVFLVCASRFPDKPTADKCLVFEDAPNGVEAAIRAGMQVVMVPDPDITDRSKATLVLNSLLDFKPESFALPPYDFQ